jgi:hypothetical protein
MEIKYTTVDTTEEDISNYLPQDSNLAGEYVVFTKFNPITDFIEAKYLVNDSVVNYVQDYTKFRTLQDSEYVLDKGVSRLRINPEADVIELGYTVPQTDVTYTFYRNLFNIKDKFETFFIDSISDDRTELRLSTFELSNDEISKIVSDIQNQLNSDSTFSDFKLLFKNGTTVLAVNIATQLVNEVLGVVVKLYSQLPSSISIKSELQVVSEVSNPISYSVLTEIIATPPKYIKISGANFNGLDAGLDGGTKYLSSVDLIDVNTYSTDTLEVISKSSEKSIPIGIEYSDLSNFIHFSSAAERLRNFVYKVQLIESYSGSLSALPSGTPSAESKQFYESGIQNVVRNFDHFEKYLYFESGSIPWPKQTSVKPYELYSSTASAAVNWYSSFLTECENYDNTNYYRLINTLPEYLKEDSDNANLVLFVDMLGQHFDNIKIYSDTISKKYDTDNRVNRGLASSLIEPVLENFGVKLYKNEFKSSQDLFKYFVLTDDEVDSEIINVTSSVSDVNISEEGYRQELYKRVYHNLPMLLKTKGTERGLKVLMSTFGIPSNIFPIKTYGGSSYKNTPYFGLELPNDSGSLNKVRLDMTGSAEGTVLVPSTSILKRQPDYQLDLHVLEVGPSPNDNINRYILTNISSSFNIDQYIGDYRGYNKINLDTVKREVLSNLERYDLKDFIRLIRFYDNTFFRMVRDFAPGRDVVDSGIIIKPHILEHSFVNDFSVNVIDETLQSELDTAFITGSDAGSFGAKSDYVTSYTDYIQYPDGITTKPISQNGYTLVGRHDGEAPRYTGEFSGSAFKAAEKELNIDNTFKKPRFFDSFYNITPISNIGSIPISSNTATISDSDYPGTASACASTSTVTVYYSGTLDDGTILFTDSNLTTVFNGSSDFYKINNTHSARVNGSGIISVYTPCPSGFVCTPLTGTTVYQSA